MALDIYYKEDLFRVLQALDMSAGGTVALMQKHMQQEGVSSVRALRLYRQGYRDALAAVAAAFGLSPENDPIESIEGYVI